MSTRLSQPFGPIDANELLGSDGKLKMHFPSVNEILYENIARKRTLIVGRKGTGKTTLKLGMRSYTEKFPHCVELNIGLEYHRVRDIIGSLSSRHSTIESASALWSDVIWIWFIVSASVNDSLPFLDPKTSDAMRTFAARFSLPTATSINSVFSRVITLLESERSARQALQPQLTAIKKVVFDALQQSEQQCCILIDTIETYNIADAAFRDCLRGLINCCSWLQTECPFVECVLFFPDELAETFKEHISSSVLKDFRDAIYIKWTGPELIRLAALRLSDYLNYRQTPDGMVPTAKSFYVIENAMDLLHIVLPPAIKDSSGQVVATLTYILRHTQLTPRQFILMLNELCASALSTKDVRKGGGLPA